MGRAAVATMARRLTVAGLRWAGTRPRLGSAGDAVVAALTTGNRPSPASHPLPRTLYEMRLALPCGERAWLAHRSLKAQNDGQDLARINDLVLSWHPDANHYQSSGISARAARPGFDPDLVVVHEVSGRVVGYCWAELRPSPYPGDGPWGLVDTVAVHPDFSGQSIGRQLILAVLGRMADAGATTALLYVEADNRRAVRLYLDMGWTVWKVKRDHTRPYLELPTRLPGS